MATAAAAQQQAQQQALRVGVMGRVTALDPLQIAGLSVEIAQDMPVISPLGPRNGSTLRVGHTLALTLEEAGESWAVKRALHLYPLVGPVDKVEGGRLQVMGSAVLPGSAEMFEGIAQGNWVGISGLWQEGGVLASRAGTIPATGFAQLTGSYVAPEEDTQNARIGGTEILGELEDEVQTGDLWVLSGSPQKGALRVGLKSSRVFAGTVDMVLAEGFASAPIASETFTLLGTGLIGHARESEMPQGDTPGLYCAVHGVILRKVPQDARLATLVAKLGCLPAAAD